MVACGAGDRESATAPVAPESEQAVQAERAAGIDAERLAEIVKVLASDEFEGRAPGTPGGKKTVAYLKEQFADLGLEPGGEGGSFVQTVPLIRTQVQAPTTKNITLGGETHA